MKAPPRTIAVLGTMDTKGDEMEFVRAEIEKHGHRGLLIDTGLIGPPHGRPDVTREQVAAAGGSSLAELLRSPSREVAAPILARGAAAIVRDLAATEKIHGIVSLGGTQGTTLGTFV